MFTANSSVSDLITDFHVGRVAMRYSLFVPRLYNLCKSLGFTPGRIIPSRAFCSDESQGYPIILIAKHFGTFPFNHGQVGGIIATDRNGPHAHHGEDLVIIHASHVGYDPATEEFGHYRRLQTHDHSDSPSCGKVCGVIGWYQAEYSYAMANVLLRRDGEEPCVVIDNRLMNDRRGDGLYLNLDRLLAMDEAGQPRMIKASSTTKSFAAAPALVAQLGEGAWGEESVEMGSRLTAELFHYRRVFSEEGRQEEGPEHLEHNLLAVMQYIVTSESPALTAAQVNTQVEFDRAFRIMSRDPSYRGKRVLFVSGLNIDLSPNPGDVFPLTKFIPWAAYYQEPDCTHQIWEQDELAARLVEQSTENADRIDLEAAIQAMEEAREVKLRVD